MSEVKENRLNNCLIIGRNGKNPISHVYTGEQLEIRVDLDGYAIIPIELYNAMKALEGVKSE